MNLPKPGDLLEFKGAEGYFYPHYTNVIAFAKENLKVGRKYEITKVSVYSSWCSVRLKDFPDQIFHLSMFRAPG